MLARFFHYKEKHNRMKLKIIYPAIALLIMAASPVFPQKPGAAYKPGEKVTYMIHYGMVNAGVTTLSVSDDTLLGKKVWHLLMDAKTIGVADALYKIRDKYESFVDPVTELPVKSIRNISEGRYRKYNEVMFDRTTRADSAILLSDLTGTHVTEQGIHDILSCFYWFRNKFMTSASVFKKGQVVTINTWFSDEFYPVSLRYDGMEEVKTKSGRIMCHRFLPVTEVGRVFESEDDMTVWFSADKNYLPVKIRFDIFVGSVTVNLTGYEGLAYPLEIK